MRTPDADEDSLFMMVTIVVVSVVGFKLIF
jgi:hypothetical protein